MSNSWEKVRMFLDTMDVQHLPPKLQSSFSSFSSSSSSSSVSHPLSISTRRWQMCEKTCQQILSAIQPNAHSENKRKEIIEYLQVLIEDAFGIKVFPFGSVPLKTYLPHGDIDLTAVTHSSRSEDLAAEICSLLEYEEKNNTYIQVKDVLCVPAQVRVVKCTVDGVSVDISVNQTAGLSALYFLEQVDRFIGEDHLLKRSVILIKAWCYYESRLLGGHHGLISTYALEIMVLHVINLFHSSLRCPLAVLYKFLDYYSTFDWNSFCVGFNGLVLISSLPEIVVQLPPDCDDLLLTDAFLRRSKEAILSSMGNVRNENPGFSVKFLNILDPLKDDNNLGRSVSKGNFFRIRSAFSYGAQNLGDILLLPLENIRIRLERFFKDTLEINKKGKRSDVAYPLGAYGSELSAGNSGNNHLLSGMHYGPWFHGNSMIEPVMPKKSDPRIWNNPWMDMSHHNVQFDQNMYYSPPSYLDGFTRTPQANVSSVKETWKSRGTGTYIPYPGHHRRVKIVVETSDEEHVTRKEHQVEKEAEALDSPACTPREANSSGEGGNIDVFNITMEDFPLLPGSKPVPIKVNQVDSPEPEQVKDSSASLDSLESDSLKQSSPTSLSLSEGGKQSDSDVSVVLDLASDPIAVTVLKEQETPKIEEKVVAPVQPPQLADDNEFPPLSRPAEPVITLSKKEFPPLRSCLKPHKWNKSKKGFK